MLRIWKSALLLAAGIKCHLHLTAALSFGGGRRVGTQKHGGADWLLILPLTSFTRSQRFDTCSHTTFGIGHINDLGFTILEETKIAPGIILGKPHVIRRMGFWPEPWRAAIAAIIVLRWRCLDELLSGDPFFKKRLGKLQFEEVLCLIGKVRAPSVSGVIDCHFFRANLPIECTAPVHGIILISS